MKRLFNRWREFSKEKPKKDGWYQCTVGLSDSERHIEQLYWYREIQQFKNKQISDIYSSCDVYAYNRVTHEYDILVKDYEEDGVVIAWKKLPRVYKK